MGLTVGKLRGCGKGGTGFHRSAQRSLGRGGGKPEVRMEFQPDCCFLGHCHFHPVPLRV